MPMRGTLPLANAKSRVFPSASYKELLMVCGLVVAGLTMCLGFAVAFPTPPDLVTQITELGG